MLTVLSLFHTSSKAYLMISRLFIMPSISTLRRTMQRFQIYPGFNEKILTAPMTTISSMPPNSALCAVEFDEMSVKEGTSYSKEKETDEDLADFGCLGRTCYVANHTTFFMVHVF